MPTILFVSRRIKRELAEEMITVSRCTYVAAAYLRICLGEIIKYAALTIMASTAETPSLADVSSLKRWVRAARCHWRRELAVPLIRFDACERSD